MQATVTMMIHSKLRKLLLCDVEDNTQVIPPAPVVLVEHDLVLRRSVWEIFVYDANGSVKHMGIPIRPYQTVIQVFRKHSDAAAVAVTQMVTTTKDVRFKVTICLYLIPKISARSLSRLMTVLRPSMNTCHNR